MSKLVIGSVVQILPAEPGWTIKMPYEDEDGSEGGYTLYPVLFWAIAVTRAFEDSADQAVVPVFWWPGDGVVSAADSDCPRDWELIAPSRIEQLVEDHPMKAAS